MKYRCVICKRGVQTRVPTGGDGSELRARRHKNPNGVQCEGWLYKPEENR